ncbi:MAG: response regulator [Candidatus Woesearchaeota archaeon]
MTDILIVDDVGIIRFKLENILKAEGFNVHEAANAKTVRKNSFSRKKTLKEIDLILLDIYLKDENGLKLLDYLTNNYPAISVIIISVETKKNIIRKAVELGAKDYISKPFNKEILLNKIYSHISREKITKKKIETTSQNPVNDLNSLKTKLSLEINRALRSKLPFSMVKIQFDDNVDDKQLTKIKEGITGKIRNIDQIYFTDDFEYTFLLPLTDKEGSGVFIEKILGEIKEKYKEDENQIQTKKVTFPEMFLNDKKDTLNPKQQDEYKNNILKTMKLE